MLYNQHTDMFRFFNTFLFICFVALWVHADSYPQSHFAPTPSSEDYPYRTCMVLNMESALAEEVQFELVYNVWNGFDLGVGLHGGITSQEGSPVGGVIGFDFLARYLRNVGSWVFLGLQTQLGFVYNGIANHTQFERAIAIPVLLGPVIGGEVRDGSLFYFFPSLELGQTMRGGNVIWLTGVGFAFITGVQLNVSDRAAIWLELRPSIPDYVNPTFRFGGSLGVLFYL